MSTAKHTAEPWSVTEKADRSLMITAPAGWYIARITASTAVGKEREVPKANAARIVACVNACAGIEHPAATLAITRALMADAACALRIAGSHWLADELEASRRALGAKK